jgi:hypothetical protein
MTLGLTAKNEYLLNMLAAALEETFLYAYFVCPIVTLHADRAEVRPCWWL